MLRSWRVLTFVDCIRETVKKSHGYLDLGKYEETHLTYFKCIDFERLASVKDLVKLGGTLGLPFGYSLKVTSHLSRLGKTSFQLENKIYAAATDQELFRSAIVHVCVDRASRQVAPHPAWWSEKYAECVKAGGGPLRVDLQSLAPKESEILCRSTDMIRAMELDYYKHASNTTYYTLAFNALLTAYYQNKLPMVSSARELEMSIKRSELDFVSDSSLGDKLDTVVFHSPNNQYQLYSGLYKDGKLIYIQSFLLDPKDSLKPSI